MSNARRDGFTLLELMITVMIIGILASIAIPSFMSYQARSRRTEAFANLQALSRSQTTFKAERDFYFSTSASFPDFTLQNSGVLGAVTMTWDVASQTEYADLGWSPEGRVYYSYEVNTEANAGCSCTDCFTASAFGDVDANGFASAAMFVHPGGDGSTCNSILFNFGAPTRLNTGTSVYDEVAINRSTDEY